MSETTIRLSDIQRHALEAISRFDVTVPIRTTTFAGLRRRGLIEIAYVPGGYRLTESGRVAINA
jgi:Mn-dependent DtxR family transcriptional regulator